LFRRGWGTYYCEDAETGKQESLKTRVKAEAVRIVGAKNEAHYQPLMNLHALFGHSTDSRNAMWRRISPPNLSWLSYNRFPKLDHVRANMAGTWRGECGEPQCVFAKLAHGLESRARLLP
jgi:hypothetical protein